MTRAILVFLLGLSGVLVLGSIVAAQGGIGLFTQVGVGTSNPGERLHVVDGNTLLEGGGETASLFKRDFTTPGDPSEKRGPSTNPIFHLGRIIKAGDGDPEFRVLYSDDETSVAYSVFEFDKKGIVASVKDTIGSHFEGFVVPLGQRADGLPKEPVFRLNSFPDMQLEFGPGGDQPTDVFIRRCGPKCLTFPQKALAGAIVADDFLIRMSRHSENNAEPLSAVEAVTAVRRLQPVTYADREALGQRHVGVSAPNRSDISAVELVALLTRVVQEQQLRIEALERRFADNPRH